MGTSEAPDPAAAVPGGLPDIAKGPPAATPAAVHDAGVAAALLNLLETAPGEAVQFLHDRGLCLVPAAVATRRFGPRAQVRSCGLKREPLKRMLALRSVVLPCLRET